MAEAYASRLASLRELSVQLTKSVLATELATLESELDNSITSMEVRFQGRDLIVGFIDFIATI